MGSPTVSTRRGQRGAAVTAALDFGLRIAGEGRWPGFALFVGTLVIAPSEISYDMVVGASLSH